MSAFWNKNNEAKKEDDKSDEVKSEKKEIKKGKAEKSKTLAGDKKKKKNAKKILNLGEKADLVNRVIINPVISEDAMTKEELGKYVFLVEKSATKSKIAQAVFAKYKVKVLKVNVMNYKSQKKNFRRSVGKTRSYKKAVVTIESGKKIELFSSKN